MAESSTSRILKAHAVRDLPSRTTFNFEDLRAQAAGELARAKAEADTLREQARQEAAAIQKQARDEGRKAGLADGLKTAQQQIEQQARQLADQKLAAQVQTLLPALQQVAAELGAQRDHWLLRWEQAAVELGIAIAEKLLRSQLAARPELALPMISEALQLAAGQPRVVVRLHPTDLAQLGEHATEVVQSLTACGSPELIADDQLSPGGCIVETQHGEVDAQLETMLTRISEELLAT